MRSAFSRNPPNVESSDCTNIEASESNWEPSTVDRAFMARPTAPVTIRPSPRLEPSSIFQRRPSMKLPNRFGASRKSNALRDGGVSTTIRSHLSSWRSWPNFSMAMYSCVPDMEVATV
ncbi:Uncharacterised protein [Mycobacteroides abscessus subsp. abscessus]|nr:Uncharacterised protein [Mycobacteroides abscessus subsp. abscessus]